MHTNIKKKGFTLAEILISLLILGVIASLTIPSLIQNTHKKEEVVKIKKGLSVISQAFALNYALTGQELSELINGDIGEDPDSYDPNGIIDMLKKRLSIVDIFQDNDTTFFITQDGLGYHLNTGTSSNEIGGTIYTKVTGTSAANDIVNSCGCDDNGCTDSPLNGCYDFKCNAHGCVAVGNTIKLINATDPTKVE